MPFQLHLASSRQRLIMLAILLPILAVCLSLVGLLLWHRPASPEGWLIVAAVVFILKPHEILSHLVLTVFARAPKTEDIVECLAPVHKHAKAMLVLDGWPAGEPLETSVSSVLLDWRWNTRVMVLSRLEPHQTPVLTRAFQKALEARFSRFERAGIAVASYGRDIALPEPVISNHALIEASRDKKQVG